jgi:feruloyl esterase
MKRLGRTIADLTRYRSDWAQHLATGVPQMLQGGEQPLPDHLTEVADFGSNPGNLRMLSFVPGAAGDDPPLVVVLHGCTQTAAGYDAGAGWSLLAERYGFALLLPEQRSSNNPKNCFTWFQAGDIERGHGEALSIRQMVDWMARNRGIDPSRVFVTGLSAGGAMTSVMLATYPDVFAGGAIVAGLPYGAASSVAEAFESMYQGKERPATEWGDLVREASPHLGPWPRVSVWHGTADATVKSSNAREIIKQWTDVHGLPAAPTRRDSVNGHQRRVWCDRAGNEALEEFVIAGMAHGTPLGPGEDEEGIGAAGPFLLEVGISSSYHIAKFWGLTEARPATEPGRATPVQPEAEIPPGAGVRQEPAPSPLAMERPSGAAAEDPRGESRPDRPAGPLGRGDRPRFPSPSGIEAVITKALRAAGLMR